MPRMEIEWVTAGHGEQDESLALEIEEFAMGWLDGYDSTVSTDLGAEPGSFPVSRQYLTRAILAATQTRRVMGACDCRECAEALADAIIAYEPKLS